MPHECEPLCPFSDRLYFTTFPHPAPHPHTLNVSPHAATQPSIRSQPKGCSSTFSDDLASYYYFMIDDQLLYLSFFQDWGPLNIAMVYKACILIHELLEDKELISHRLVLYSSSDPRKKANAALLMCLYVMIVQRRAPWEAFHPIAELEFRPFRDAGRGPSDFSLNIQDCLWGMWKAMQNGLCDMNEFSVEDYEYYEKVENGDWNWLTPHFIAFASPVDSNWLKRDSEAKENSSRTETKAVKQNPQSHLALQRKLPQAFINCLDYFEKRNVRLVVRLNTELYDRNTFLDRGIDHMELYFDDGTNPTDAIVRTFIDVADRVIEAGGVVAVHCKAGLGRTGTLIGAYLIWKYNFTANEVIAFMRTIRPGSVVGPQQQYMYLKQLEWAKWGALDELRKARAASVVAASTVVAPATPPSEVDEDMSIVPASTFYSECPISLPPVTPSRHVSTATAKASGIAPPGQPRKTPAGKRVAEDTDDEGDDTLPSLIVPCLRSKMKTSKVIASRGVTASEHRPIRVTRSTAGATAIRKAGAGALLTPIAASPVSSSKGSNKIPRLTTTKTTSAAKALVAASPLHNASVKSQKTASTRRNVQSPQPPLRSRLPMLSPSKKPCHAHTTSLTEVGASSTFRQPEESWMITNAAAIVAPQIKSGRPALRSVRRRRSSFSAADVVA